MALLLTEGFDHYASEQAIEKFWTGHIVGMVPGRGFGGQAISVVNLNPVYKDFPAASPIIVGVAIKLTGVVVPQKFMTIEIGGGGLGVEIGTDSTHHLTLTDSAAHLVATGPTIIPLGTWFYIEVKLEKGGAGHVTLHLNGAAEIPSTVGNFGTADFGRIVFWNHALGDGLTDADDIYVIDTTGSAPLNDFLGEIRIETLYPVADASYTAWTPKTGTDHFAMVDEHLIDGDGSFVYDATPGDKDTYKLDTFIGSIYGAQLNIGARKGDASVRQIAPLIRQAGTDHVGVTHTLSSDYVFYSWLLDNDPTGSPWLAATIIADEFGQELIA
jgi:hypothetical protein